MQEIQAMQVRDEREEKEGGEKATLQHVMLGRCGGMDVSERDTYLSELRRRFDELRKRVRSGGKDLQHAMAVAYAGVAAATRGDVVKQEQWEAVQRVLCGVLPDYAGKDVKARLTCKERISLLARKRLLLTVLHALIDAHRRVRSLERASSKSSSASRSSTLRSSSMRAHAAACVLRHTKTWTFSVFSAERKFQK